MFKSQKSGDEVAVTLNGAILFDSSMVPVSFKAYRTATLEAARRQRLSDLGQLPNGIYSVKALANPYLPLSSNFGKGF